MISCQSLYAETNLCRIGSDALGGGAYKMIFMKIQLGHTFADIINIENLLEAWREFSKGKRQKQDVQEFQLHLMDNLFELRYDLLAHQYGHGPYFAKKFIADSFSCQRGKGTHRALDRFRAFAYQVSKNHTRTAWVLKCDIRKFFANIDHGILKRILSEHIPDRDILWLLNQIIDSFHPGLPLGNLTSQLLVNICMNEFDQFVKHKLKVRYYIRYADDFVLLSYDRHALSELLLQIDSFLKGQLNLHLHENKVFIKTFASGVDFLGWVHFPDHRVLRTSTKWRMVKKLNDRNTSSYGGLLGHGNTEKIKSAYQKKFNFVMLEP